jgi:predicted ArsR family transcriptional regulator
MSDQPRHVVDHDNDRPTDQVVAANQPPTDQAGLSLEEAADDLGISVNAVRQRLKRGTLQGEKTATGWVVFLSANQATAGGVGRQPTGQPSTSARPATDRPSDLEPLAGLIADLSRENRELAAAAALWQERARFLSERLAALEAGPIAAQESADAAVDANLAPQRDETRETGEMTLNQGRETLQPASDRLALRWRRWWRQVMGGG